MKKYMRILIVITLLAMGSNGAWATDGLQLKNNLGTNATVGWYDYGTTEPTAATFSTAAPGTSLAAATEYALGNHYVVVHIVPADGYWTNEKLLFSYETKTTLARTRAPGLELGQTVTLLKADDGRKDGAGWYYYQVPAEHAGYTNSILDGYVVPKFDLNSATVSGTTVTTSNGDWKAVVKLNKVSFTYNGSTQRPAVSSITISRGTTDVLTFSGGTHNITVSGGGSSAGSHTATLTADNNGIFTGSKSVSISISSATMTGVSAKGYSGVYDGQGHSIAVTKPSGASVKYRTTKTGSYNLSTNPTFTDVGEYTVYYQVSKSNYSTKTGNAKVTITAKELTVKADDVSKLFQAEDPTLTYQVDGLCGDDELTGSLERTEGEDVGTYDINQGTLSASDNYTIAFTPGTFEITAKTVDEPTIRLSETFFFYDGTAKEPKVTVEVGETTIPETEYTVSYSDNTEAGTATVTITDNEGGNYTVSGTVTFVIGIRGDANGDGLVNVADIVEMINAKNDKASDLFMLKNADTDGDGEITQDDIDAVRVIIMNAAI